MPPGRDAHTVDIDNHLKGTGMTTDAQAVTSEELDHGKLDAFVGKFVASWARR